MPAWLIEGDAFETLERIPAGAFALALADPPYLLGKIPRVRRDHLTAVDGGALLHPESA